MADMVQDPVCGMEIRPEDAAARPVTTRSWPTRIATVTRPRSTAASRITDPGG